jgi:DNA-binding CsgD family transcriptional regulator
MAASGLLRERDLRALTAVIEDGLRDDPGPAVPWAVLRRLHQLIPADAVLFEEADPQNRQPIADQILYDGEHEWFDGPELPAPEVWVARGAFLPYTYWSRTDDAAAVRWSDFYAQTELKNQPFYDMRHQDSAMRYAINVPLLAAAGWIRRVGLFRTHRDFNERDRLVLQLLRPHLHEVYLDAERRRTGVPYLTRRERDILQLVSQGYSNAEIAGTLFIAVATVRKHLENIFNRTGVRTRRAAAAIALPPAASFSPTPVRRRSAVIRADEPPRHTPSSGRGGGQNFPKMTGEARTSIPPRATNPGSMIGAEQDSPDIAEGAASRS